MTNVRIEYFLSDGDGQPTSTKIGYTANPTRETAADCVDGFNLIKAGAKAGAFPSGSLIPCWMRVSEYEGREEPPTELITLGPDGKPVTLRLEPEVESADDDIPFE